ncbi:Alpha/Beta hydrolase protein [Thelonectria olida]|uniref:Acyl-protein thioesterase 1 n=1 Tax=Thelonectria olida TaxID=1576542 RepID=A0A9P9AWD6_9HYPO|nr:Alpha/Beta hydrolase protein [Thelonectria olida]
MATKSRMGKYIVSPSFQHLCTFICLHDCESCSTGFDAQLSAASHPDQLKHLFPHARLVFPDAPFRGDGTNLRNWYSLEPFQAHTASRGEWQRIANVAASLEGLVEQEAQLVGRDGVFVIGFGMGASIGTTLLLKTDQPFGGFIGIGGWVPYIDDLIAVAAQEYHEQQSQPAPTSAMNRIELSDVGFFDFLQGTLDTGLFDTAFNPSKSSPQPEHLDPLERPAGPHPAQSLLERFLRVTNFLRGLTFSERADKAERTSLGTPALFIHANNDPLVPYGHATEAVGLLKSLGFVPELKSVKENTHKVTKQQFIISVNALLANALLPPAARTTITRNFPHVLQ